MGDGEFMVREWVEIELGGLKDIVYAQTGRTGFNKYPFEDIDIRQAFQWTARAGIGSDESDGQVLRLRHNAFFKDDSGAASFKAANNYKVEMVLISDNYDYFNDEMLIKNRVEEEKNIVTDSYVRSILDGNTNDYVSIDTGSDHSGIANFNLRLNGDFIYKDSKKMSNDCDVMVTRVWYYQEMTEPEPTDDERQEEAIEEFNEEYKNEQGDGDLTTNPCGAGFIYDPILDRCVIDENAPPEWTDYIIVVGAFALVGVAIGVIQWRRS